MFFWYQLLLTLYHICCNTTYLKTIEPWIPRFPLKKTKEVKNAISTIYKIEQNLFLTH